MLVNKLGVDVLLLMLRRLRSCKSFQSDNYVHYDLNNSTLDFLIYSLSPGFWQSFISVEVCRDCIPALASSCKKQLTGFFVCLLFFLKVKRIS